MKPPPNPPGYALEACLGSGTYGEVWSALQEGTGQKVALKFFTRQRGMEWFYSEHELSVLREVAEHPNVIGLLDANMDHEPPYLVMPKLARGSLAEGGPYPLEQCARWLQQLAEALQSTHRKGIFHCDLKPSNVLLDEHDNALLADFGQSRSGEIDLPALGTPGYMAPEQARGGSPQVSWDVYGLGATGYFLLTGRRPDLPWVPVRTLRPEVDVDLAQIVESCLSASPDRRIGSMAELLDDLRRRRHGSPLLCCRPWSFRYRLNRFLGKPLVAVSVFGLLFCPLFVNTYLTLTAMDSLYKETSRRVVDVNDLARRLHGTPAALTSSEYRHYLVDADHKVVQAFNDPAPPARLDLGQVTHVGVVANGRGLRVLRAQGKAGAWTLVTEIEASRVHWSLEEMKRRNAYLNVLILSVTSLLGVLAFRLTGGEGQG